MEIHSLKVTITEADLNALVQKHLDNDQPIEDLRIRIKPDGVHVKGVYPLFINVSFETHWELGIESGKVCARLVNLRALGVPGNVFKSAIVKLIADAAKGEPWLRFERDTVTVDVDQAMVENGLAAARM